MSSHLLFTCLLATVFTTSLATHWQHCYDGEINGTFTSDDDFKLITCPMDDNTCLTISYVEDGIPRFEKGCLKSYFGHPCYAKTLLAYFEEFKGINMTVNCCFAEACNTGDIVMPQ